MKRMLYARAALGDLLSSAAGPRPQTTDVHIPRDIGVRGAGIGLLQTTMPQREAWDVGKGFHLLFFSTLTYGRWELLDLFSCHVASHRTGLLWPILRVFEVSDRRRRAPQAARRRRNEKGRWGFPSGLDFAPRGCDCDCRLLAITFEQRGLFARCTLGLGPNARGEGE